MCQIQTTMSILSTAVIRFKGTERKMQHCVLYHYYDKVAPKRPIGRFKLITSSNVNKYILDYISGSVV